MSESRQERNERREREELANKRELEALSASRGGADVVGSVVSAERNRFSAALDAGGSRDALTGPFEALSRLAHSLAKQRDGYYESFSRSHHRADERDREKRELELQLRDARDEVERANGTIKSLRMDRETLEDDVASYRQEVADSRPVGSVTVDRNGAEPDEMAGRYYLNEYVETSRKVTATDGSEISYPTRECIRTLGEFDSAEEAEKTRLDVYAERERSVAPLPGIGGHRFLSGAPELLVQDLPGARVPRQGAVVVQSRIDIAPDACAEPGLRAFARHQGCHYMERWPVLQLRAALGQPEERVACRAVAMTPNGVMIVRDAQPDEKAATGDARDACAMRDIRLRSALRELLVERGCPSDRMPVHVMTVGTNEAPLFSLKPSSVLGGVGSEVLKMTTDGSSMRCPPTSDYASLATWELAVSRSKRSPHIVADQVKDTLMPNLPICQSNPLFAQQALSYAVGRFNDLSDEGSDFPYHPVQLRGEAAALRALVRAVRPEETVRDLPPVTSRDFVGRAISDSVSASMKALMNQGLFPPNSDVVVPGPASERSRTRPHAGRSRFE